ncbi:MAG TPA: nuclear transport factor 2 family protein [Pyrinomonadaceae bacterium]
MKRISSLLALSLAFSIVLLSGCQKAAENTNTVATTPSPATETIDAAAIETELMRIENDWPRVIKEKDVDAVKRVEADNGVFVYPDGSVGDKATDVRDIESGALTADSWEVMDLKVIVLNKDAATVSGRSVVKNGKYRMPDGKTMDISGQYRFVDTFARRNGEWKLVAGASTPIREAGAAASPSPASKPTPTVAASPAATASPRIRPLPPIIVPPRLRVSPTPRPPQ